jgi:hypothetical protein
MSPIWIRHAAVLLLVIVTAHALESSGKLSGIDVSRWQVNFGFA